MIRKEKNGAWRKELRGFIDAKWNRITGHCSEKEKKIYLQESRNGSRTSIGIK